MKEKRKITAFISILLFATFLIACEAEQTAEVIEGAVIEEEEVIEVKEIVDEPDLEPELLETVETPVIIEKWQPMQLIIPAINLDLRCLGDGDVFDSALLRRGPTRFQMSDLPSTEKGNFALAGMWKFFDQIDNLVEGDEIYLDVAEYRFIYEVVWKEVVDKYDWGAIDTTDYPSITLQTSYPIDYSAPNPDYRLNVRGELREVVKAPGN